MEDIFEDDFDGAVLEGELASWVMGKCQDWRDHYESNYSQRHEEYMRLFRNKWSAEDLSLIHISEPTNQRGSRMPSSA